MQSMQVSEQVKVHFLFHLMDGSTKTVKKISIESATVAGDIKYLLKNIVNIESSQEVTTSGISPHIWVDELSITGDA